MKTVKKTITIYLSIAPIDHPSHAPFSKVCVDWRPMDENGLEIKCFQVEVDVPVRFETIPDEAVKTIP